MPEWVDAATRARAVRAAQGLEPFDRLLAGATLADVATGELRPADIGIVGPMVASVHPPGARDDAAAVEDLAGLVLAPGLIDSHVHFESSFMVPSDYAAVVVPAGTTTAAWDPHELANVAGLDGVRWAVRASRNLPLRVLVLASSCVPSAPGLEVAGAEFGAAEIAEMLSWPEVAGIAEVMDMGGVLRADPRMAGVVGAGLASGKPVMGHARGLSGPALQGFAAAGISSDHEITSGADLIEKLRAGLTVELRGSHDYVLPEAVAALNALPAIPSTLVACTDDVLPDELVAKGGMRDVLARLVARGLDPVAALRCATLNAAIRLRRDDLGLVAPGRRADLIALSDLREMRVARTWASGHPVACEGALLAPVPRAAADGAAGLRGTVRVPALDAAAFVLRVPGVERGRARLRAISGARFTRLVEAEVEVSAGRAAVPPGFSVLAAIHRHGRRPAVPAVALIHDWGEWRGALATTVAHDSHNLLVFGRDPADMAVAANAVIAADGGMAVARGGEVLEVLRLPVAGLLSELPPAETARAFARLRASADAVCDWQPPYRVFRAVTGASLACNAGPHLTDLGIADAASGGILDPVLEAAPA